MGRNPGHPHGDAEPPSRERRFANYPQNYPTTATSTQGAAISPSQRPAGDAKIEVQYSVGTRWTIWGQLLVQVLVQRLVHRAATDSSCSPSLSQLRQRGGDRLVPILGGVLIAHSRSRRRMAQAGHQLGQGRAGLGCQDSPGVTQVVKT